MAEDRLADTTAPGTEQGAGVDELERALATATRRTETAEQKADAEWLRAEDASQRAAELQTELHRTTRELQEIHGSSIWSLWTGYHSMRKGARRFLRRGSSFAGWVLRGIYGRIRRVAYWGWCNTLRVLRWVRRGVMTGPRLLGRLYLTLWARRRRRLASRRRELEAPGMAAAAATLAPGRSPAREVLARRPRVLLVSPYPVYPPNHGGGVRLFNLIRRVGREVDLHLVVFSREGDEAEQRAALEPYCQSFWVHRWYPKIDPDFFRLSAVSAQIFRSAELTEHLRATVVKERIDVLQLEYTELGQYAAVVHAPKTILTEIDVTFRSRIRRRAAGFHRKYRQDRAFGSSRGDSWRQLRYELEACGAADQIHVMSSTDGEYLASFLDDGGERMRVVPNAVDTESLTPPAEGSPRAGTLFVGNFQHLPNLDAIDFLLGEIWPRVRTAKADAELSVVGVAPPDRVVAAGGRDGVRVHGEVPEVAPYLRSHEVMIAPIRAGSGTRLKILEAMACGLPVVSTALGAEGIDVEPERHLLLAEDAAGLAKQTSRLLADPALAAELAAAARRRVVEMYDWDASAARLLAAYWELMPEPSREATRRRAQEIRSREGAEVSVIIPTFRGGAVLERTLAAIAGQETERSVEIVCVDSGSPEQDLETMRRYGARIEGIDQADFDHGLTRDLGARISTGRVLVFINQDAVPADSGWLDGLTGALFDGDPEIAAVQGGIRELPDPEQRFYWDSCGHRFYFTSESDRWIERFAGIGFSTVNAALRREAWELHPFGRAAIMEDKKWQREVMEAGWTIAMRDEAYVLHTHDYDFRALVRRCYSEGYGWQLLGERYRVRDLLRDLARPRVYADLLQGLYRGRVGSAAELLFPLARPLSLYWGNAAGSGVKH